MHRTTIKYKNIATNAKKYAKRLLLILFALTAVLFLSCSNQEHNEKTIYTSDASKAYQTMLSSLLEEYDVKSCTNSSLHYLNKGYPCEAFDIQAYQAIREGFAVYWYPQHLATVIIAVDRDKTDVALHTWSDLLQTEEAIGYMSDQGNSFSGRCLFAAISHGLKNDHYMSREAIDFLVRLQQRKQLLTNNSNTAILICFDYQAVELAKQGRNLEIIVPTEGTLSFEKGLLSTKELYISNQAENSLLAAGLRLPDGRNQAAVYPNEQSYLSATCITDPARFIAETNKYTSVLTREILGTHRYKAADGIEHNMIVLFVAMFVVLFVGIIARNILERITWRIFFTSGLLLIGWIFLQYLKYMVYGETLERFLWYGYFVFILGLPLSMLWLAWSLDETKLKETSAVWLKRSIMIFYGLLLICIFTNDLHHWMFVPNFKNPAWSIHYRYGWLFYITITLAFVLTLASNALLVKKAWQSTRWRGIVLPLIFYVLMLVYEIAFVCGHPFVVDTDVVITTVMLFLLYFMLVMVAGLIPINRKYKELFSRSLLKMQIVNTHGTPLLAARAADPIDQATWEKAATSFGTAIEKDKHTLLYAHPIPGGYILWQENIAELQKLYKQTEELGHRIKRANALLVKEKDIKAAAAKQEQKLQLVTMIEKEISIKMKQANQLIRALPESKNKKLEMGKIAMLLCYIKRRCILFFREREAKELPVEDVLFYLKELSEFAKHVNIGLLILGNDEEMITSRQATLLYDFLYEVLWTCAGESRSNIVAQLVFEEKHVRFKLLLSLLFIQRDFIPITLKDAVEKEGGSITIKELDDMAGVELTFVRGRYGG